MPPPNPRRRAELADAAIALLAETGVHGVTHRAVERRAGLPTGTAVNYFRSREALLVAAADRVGELHYADMDAAGSAYRPTSASSRGRAVDLIAGSLFTAATTYRDRYLAIFELRLESLRRPALAEALRGLLRRSVAFTTGHHADLGLRIPPEAVPTLVTLYGGALFTLVSSPPGEVSPELARELAGAIVRAALGDA
ncbi:TetR family transcriptional regulator [Micromonospora sp. WMMD1102]|uniref:TetR/AcrR family transcriptional regulator n=1 Tax=Micromonospora sp. WMMD1102 TaxID=3016105 RepID=UPI002414E18F|nr:TetR/AcrR family transcriptional regulator [Micromonospora sp. WMMD1102]MDG4785361.1 TetR family transcriptional regulator [Micromonospora sp. WMMD1102]